MCQTIAITSLTSLLVVMMVLTMLSSVRSYLLHEMRVHRRGPMTSRGSISSSGIDWSPRKQSDLQQSQALYAKKRNKSAGEDIPAIRTDPGWVTIKLGKGSKFPLLDGNDDVVAQRDIDRLLETNEMDSRIQEAKQWESRKLSAKDQSEMKRKQGIDEVLLSAIATDEDDDDDGSSSSGKKSNKKVDRKKSTSKSGSTDHGDALSRLKGEFETSEYKEAARLRGFLELNPFLCSGCGTAFQSKSPNNPGFLPKDKFVEHQKRSETIRQRQEAIKILEMAGMDVTTAAAADLLREAKVSEEVIAGVQLIGRQVRAGSDEADDDEGDDDAWADPSLSEQQQKQQQSMSRSPFKLQPIVSTSTSAAAATSTPPLAYPLLDIDAYNSRYNHLAGSKAKRVVGSKATAAAAAPTTIEAESVGDAIDDSTCICQRCFRLQQYGQVEESLRPGWSDHELLTPERFEGLLSTIKDTPAVVLCLVDIFDLRGSLLSNLKAIAGKNPLLLAANKVDLLPKDVSLVRLTNWIYAEVKQVCGYRSPREDNPDRFNRPPATAMRTKVTDDSDDSAAVLRRNSVHLVSCQSGMGMDRLLGDLMSVAKDNGNRIYVMGAANVGKSSFINRLLVTSNMRGKDSKRSGSSKSSLKDKSGPMATVSNLPGTTLDFLKIKLPNGVTLVDTPGLLNKGQLTSKLTIAELRQVIPSKPVNSVTLRLSEGKCVLIGGLAKIDFLEVCCH